LMDKGSWSFFIAIFIKRKRNRMNFITEVIDGIHKGLQTWEPRLVVLTEEIISQRRNNQNRSIRQILGHLVDSASNNTHRIIHLQYRESPVSFPNYASQGNNDRWIAIQNYQHEEWHNLVQLWKYTNLHLAHILKNVDADKLDHVWISGSESGNITLRDMITSYLKHFYLHLHEINALLADEKICAS
jgi:hypothetical protein